MENCDACAGGIDRTQRVDPHIVIEGLRPGDIFHATASSAASFILLVTEVRLDFIAARRVTTQEYFVFDRRTGQAVEPDDARGLVWIDAVEPLPAKHHNTLLDLDRRYRLGRDADRFRLSKAEQATLLYSNSFYAKFGFADFTPERTEG